MNDKIYFMIDMRRLRVLHAVSAYGSVTAAAAALGYSAPAVSQQLAALEREVGMRLTERAGRGLELTPAAQILVGHTDALLARLDAAEADLAALRDQVAGQVTLAAFPSAAASLVPAAWAALAGSAPQVRLDLTEMEPEESLPAVLRGETDVAVAHEYDLLPRPLDPLFERRELLDDPVVLAIPADGTVPLAADGPVPLATLAGSAVPRPAPVHQLRRDDPAGLCPGRLRAPRGRPRLGLPDPAQPGRGGGGRHPGAGAGRPAAAPWGPADPARRAGDPPGLHRQPPRWRP